MSASKDFSDAPPAYSSFALSESPIFSDRLSRVRISHLTDIISRYVLPIVDQRLQRAIGRTTIALILSPKATSECFVDDTDFKQSPPEILGLVSHDEFDAQVRLEGEMNSVAFWTQPVVLADLQELIKVSWQSDSMTVSRRGDQYTRVYSSTKSESDSPIQHERQAQRKVQSQYARCIGSNTTAQERVNMGPASNKKMTVVTELDEICFRSLTNFGLFETLKEPAVVISIDISG